VTYNLHITLRIAESHDLTGLSQDNVLTYISSISSRLSLFTFWTCNSLNSKWQGEKYFMYVHILDRCFQLVSWRMRNLFLQPWAHLWNSSIELSLEECMGSVCYVFTKQGVEHSFKCFHIHPWKSVHAVVCTEMYSSLHLSVNIHLMD